MTITSLIDKQDNLELVRQAVASILVSEVTSQQALATAGAQDPRLWALRVFEERERPWTSFMEAAQKNTPQEDVPPIVSVRVGSADVDLAASNPVSAQTYNGQILIDCHGYGVSQGAGPGHTPGDKRAADEAMRAARLVRNILMAGKYTYLGMQGIVGRRMVTSIQAYHDEEPKAGTNIAAVRLVLAVRYGETSPQIVPEVIAGVDIDVTRLSTGEVLAAVSYGATGGQTQLPSPFPVGF